MYRDNLKKYLDDLAANLPAPGGGSAAALTAATGVALISMVANFTVGKEKYKSVEEEMRRILTYVEELRERLTNLVDEDVAAYKKIASVYKLPKESAEDKRKRKAAIQQGLKEALGPPLEICRLCFEAIKLCPAAAEKGNPNLISDVGVAIELLQAAFQGALLNVQINLKEIEDEHFILEIREILEPMEKEIEPISLEVRKRVEGGMK
jgi:formiminotetrahydrofolate cyclodeaminase